MRIFLVVLLLLQPYSRLLSQETLKEISFHLPVQVRVYRDADFVDNLTLEDFLLSEDGARQQIEGFCYVKNGRIQRCQGLESGHPDVTRNFCLFFDIASFTPEIRKAVHFFLTEVLRPLDNLFIVTRRRAFRMKNSVLAGLPKKELTRQLETLFVDDALDSLPEYQTAFTDLKRLVERAGASADPAGIFPSSRPGQPEWPSGITRDALVIRYYSLLSALEKIRKIDERRLLDHIEMLRFQEGSKFAFFFYQRESLPRIPSEVLQEYLNNNQERRDVLQTLIYLEDFHNRDFFVDNTRLSQALATAGIILHFLCFDLPRADSLSDFEAARLSSFFRRLEAISRFSGAAFKARLSPQKLLTRVSSWMDEYYLLFYAPRVYAGDGRFKPIRISIKDRNYTVRHRAGYISE